jgi:signal transduction histidine kinase/ActR/RegA family two-component response regulator
MPGLEKPRAGQGRVSTALHGLRLSTRLLLVIATCLVPTVALQLGASWNQWAERKAQLDSIVTQQAQLLAGNVESIVQGARILLGAASEFRQVRHRDTGCSARLASLQRHAPGFAFIALMEADGRIGCASDSSLLAAPGEAAWLRPAGEVRRFTTGRFLRPAMAPGGILPFYLPIAANEVAGPGTLVAALDLTWLGGHLEKLKRTGLPFLANGVLTVSDADGMILGRDIRHADFVGQRFPPAALPLLEATAPGILRLHSIDGTNRLVGYTPPTEANHGLSAVVGVYEPDLMGDIENTLLRGAALLALVSLLAMGLTLLVARRFITRPTAALLAVARRWREGDLPARAPSGAHGSEFGQLAAAYNDMAAALQCREEEMRGHAAALEAAVVERTSALTEANRRLQAEIDERRSTEAALVQAQKVQAVGQLAGGIAHDFNNVLQAVLGGVALIHRRASDTAAVQRLARMIEDSARRGETITRRLLTFSRREPLKAEPLELCELLEGLREVLRASLGSRIQVELAVEPGLPAVLADRGQLETVLVNLATNARDAMPSGGTLTLRAELVQVQADATDGELSAGSYVRLAATDTGEGMDASTLARAFEPFFTTKPLGQGTGLGLAMARSFAQASRGRLAITSAVGKGTTVSIWLPVLETTPREPQEARPARRARPLGTPRILLADDETVVREVLAGQLEDAGFEVMQAADGGAALELLDGGHCFDVLVSDLAMPGLDGVGLIREAQRRHPGLPAILLTGFAGDAATLAVGTAVAGRFMLMRKPVSGGELADQIAALLEAVAREVQPAR